MRELFLLNIGGMKYGVWKDEILSIKDLQTIQWLPPICRSIAGMSILEGRTLTPIDLAVCIGLSPVTGEGKSHILVLSEREKVAGFVVEGEIGHLTIPPNAVFPCPITSGRRCSIRA